MFTSQDLHYTLAELILTAGGFLTVMKVKFSYLNVHKFIVLYLERRTSFHIKPITILLIEALIRSAGQTVPMFVFSWSTLCILYSYKEVLQEIVCHIALIFCTSQSLVTREIWRSRKESSSIERSSDYMLALRKNPYNSTFQLEILWPFGKATYSLYIMVSWAGVD